MSRRRRKRMLKPKDWQRIYQKVLDGFNDIYDTRKPQDDGSVLEWTYYTSLADPSDICVSLIWRKGCGKVVVLKTYSLDLSDWVMEHEQGEGS